MSIDQNNEKISIIIPIYNESKYIINCLTSLQNQDYKQTEIILVDDGSSDRSVSKIKNFLRKEKNKNVRLLYQRHMGPGAARNFGAKKATGKIFVFVDADMTFDACFLANLVDPILKNGVIGTDSQEEYLVNPNCFWAKCWNIGRFAAANYSEIPRDHKINPKSVTQSTIFRAIKKSEFEKVDGFSVDGDYTDDESLSKKLDAKSLVVKAKYYHYDPDSFSEVWQRAGWIGSGKNFTGSTHLQLKNLIKFSLPASFLKGLAVSLWYKHSQFLFFKLIYDFAVWLSVIKSLLQKLIYPEIPLARRGD